MLRNKILLGVIAVVVIGGGVTYFLLNNKPKEQAQETRPAPIPALPDQFINESAQEVKQAYDQETEAKANDEKKVEEKKVVTPNPVPVVTRAAGEICTGSESSNFDCYETYYRGLVQSSGVQVAFDDLKNRYETSSYIKSQCHPVAHVIGRAAVEKFPQVSQAYAQGDSFCWSGYYHGVLEGVIGKVGRSQLEAQLNTICDDVPGKATYNFDYYNCVHGLGHGVMVYTNNELFEALKLCDNLSGAWEQTSCHSGVFMENIIIDNKNHFTKYLKPSDPLYPCNAVDDKYKNICFLMQTSYMLKVTNGDFAKVFNLCSTVPNYEHTCYQSLGRDASGRSISTVGGTKAACELGTTYDQKSNCYIGAVKDFVSYFHSDAQAKELCASLTSDLQQVCYSTTENYYKTLQ